MRGKVSRTSSLVRLMAGMRERVRVTNNYRDWEDLFFWDILSDLHV